MMRQATLGYHLVAFLDVLGQREKFKSLRLPTSQKEHAEVAEILRQTAGFVMELRESFKEQFAQFDSGLMHLKSHAGPTVVPKLVGFSDSFVAHVPLRTDKGEVQMLASVFSTLSAAAVVMLVSLASKHPLRGGIDVGLATELGDSEIYGIALEKAYLLESHVAESPRIVIGDELWTFLNVARSQFQSAEHPCAKIVDATFQLIAEDTDGKRILHYLSPFILSRGGRKCLEIMVKPALEFVRDEYDRVLAEGNAKLMPRYAALQTYFENSSPISSSPTGAES